MAHRKRTLQESIKMGVIMGATARQFHGIGTRCTCYVGRLPDVVLFEAGRGIHNPACPVYQPSLDPVDRLNDDDFRRMAEITAPGVVDVLAERGATLRKGATI